MFSFIFVVGNPVVIEITISTSSIFKTHQPTNGETFGFHVSKKMFEVMSKFFYLIYSGKGTI